MEVSLHNIVAALLEVLSTTRCLILHPFSVIVLLYIPPIFQQSQLWQLCLLLGDFGHNHNELLPGIQTELQVMARRQRQTNCMEKLLENAENQTGRQFEFAYRLCHHHKEISYRA